MIPDTIDRVFGRGRLKMATGPHVEVFREAAAPGESRRYTKRFVSTADGDYGEWTEREWRILARLIGHGVRCVPDVVQYDRGARGTKLVQTYDAGATVDQWATLLPVSRDHAVHAHVFQDCAHWWALAHHCLVALDEIHTIQLVHLDVKGDNICIPVGPANFDPLAADQAMFPVFGKLALIDFAFSLVSGETLTSPLPIGWEQSYDYQSPRLLRALEAGRAGDLQPTQALDWRCDIYSLAAMLERYLPIRRTLAGGAGSSGWTDERYDAAKSLIMRLRDAHDGSGTAQRPHAALIALTSTQIGHDELARSLERGWTLAHDARLPPAVALPMTPVTRIAPPVRLVIPPRDDVVSVRMTPVVRAQTTSGTPESLRPSRLRPAAAALAVAAIVGIVPFFIDAPAWVERATRSAIDGGQTVAAAVRALFEWSGSGATEPSEAPTAQAGNGGPVPDESSRNASTTRDDVPPKDDAAAPSPLAERASAASSTQEEGEARGTGGQKNEAAPAPAHAHGAGPSAPAPGSRSLAAQIESYRGKSIEIPGPTARSPAAPRGSSARIDGSRQARVETGPRAASRAGSSGAAVTSRTPPAGVASKRSARSSSVAAGDGSRRVATSQPIASVRAPVNAASAVSPRENPAAASPPSREVSTPVSPAAPAVAASNVVAPSTNAVAPSANASAAADNRPSAPSAPTAVTTFPIAPPVEAPRPASVPETNTSRERMAAMVEAPRPASAPETGTTRERMAPIVEPPRTWMAPGMQPPRPLAAAPAPDRRPDRATPPDADEPDYFAEGSRMVAGLLPRTTPRLYEQVARVLAAAANAHHPAQERAVAAAFAFAGVAADASFAARERAPDEARRLHEEAKQAYWTRRHVPDAFDFQLAAFGANPLDQEIAGMLAFLHLRTAPAQPERARQLSLHALGIRSAQYPMGRPDDWTTFAIASALTGRQADAKHALFAALALSGNLDRSCRAALGALAVHGERLREPVEALFARLYAQGRDDDSPYCYRQIDRSAVARFR